MEWSSQTEDFAKSRNKVEVKWCVPFRYIGAVGNGTVARARSRVILDFRFWIFDDGWNQQ
jgi:hypothetical protein